MYRFSPKLLIQSPCNLNHKEHVFFKLIIQNYFYQVKKCIFRKINNYIGEKNKRQEEFEKEKESLTTGIQVFSYFRTFKKNVLEKSISYYNVLSIIQLNKLKEANFIRTRHKK